MNKLSNTKRAIFTDRDGVLNKIVWRGSDPGSPNFRDELEFFPGVREAIQKAHDNGYKVFVVSNQPTAHIDFLEYVSSVLIHTFGVDGIMCARNKGSNFYKPNPGMLEEFMSIYNLSPENCWMIGDRWKDAIAAKLAKVAYIHIHGEDPLTSFYHIAHSFSEAVDVAIGFDKVRSFLRSIDNDSTSLV